MSYYDRSAFLPQFNCQVTVTFSAKPKSVTRMRHTYYAGDELSDNVTLDRLVEVVKVEPTNKRVFDFSTHTTNKIDCIKAIREVTYLGLKEAKETVEAFVASGSTIIVITF
jgi:hypothetical protein